MKLQNPLKLTDRITLDLRDSKGRYSTPERAKYFALYLDNIPYYADEFEKASIPITKKEEIITEYFLDILAETPSLTPKRQKYEPTFDYEPDEIEEIEEEIDVTEFDDILDKHDVLSKQEKWIFPKSELMTDVYQDEKINKDFMVTPVYLPTNDVYDSYVLARVTFNTAYKLYYPSIENRITLHDIIEVGSMDELLQLVPLLDNLIYIHSLKAQRQMKNIVLESIYAVVKYTIRDEDGNEEEKYISFRQQRNGGLLNSVNQFSSEQAIGMTFQKENEKTLLRYLQGYEFLDNGKVKKGKRKSYFSVDELILKFTFDGESRPDIPQGDIKQINDVRNEIMDSVFRMLKKQG